MNQRSLLLFRSERRLLEISRAALKTATIVRLNFPLAKDQIIRPQEADEEDESLVQNEQIRRAHEDRSPLSAKGVSEAGASNRPFPR